MDPFQFPTLQTIAIITKRSVAEEKVDFLKHAISLIKKHHKEVYLDHNAASVLEAQKSYSQDELLEICDAVIVVGGDGTLLKTAGHVGKKAVPILAVNLGNLGFLTETDPERFEQDLGYFFQNDYTIDSRSLLQVTHIRSQETLNTFLALNDAVMNQGSFARLIQLDIDINAQRAISFKADGLIVSSTTGSTAHSLSAGGPIVHPSLPAVILTPLCPASLSIRPIVIPNESDLTITLETKRRETQDVGLTIDGQQTVPLHYGDIIHITKSDRSFNLVRIKKQQNYYATLRSKLHWGGAGQD